MNEGHDFARAIEVMGDWLLAEGRYAGFDRRLQEFGVGGGGGGDDDGVDGGQQFVVGGDVAKVQIAGDGHGKVRTGVLQENLGYVRMRHEPFGQCGRPMRPTPARLRACQFPPLCDCRPSRPGSEVPL